MRHGLMLIVLIGVFISCGRQSDPKSTKFNFKWRESNSISDERTFSVGENILLPTSARNFDCFFLNITGPDIPSKNPLVSPAIFGQMRDGGSCSYPGIVTKPMALASGNDLDFTIDLPVGPERLIQVGGIINVDGGDCTQIDFNNPATYEQTTGKKFRAFELGRTFVTNLFGPAALTIPKNYDSTQPRRMDCETTSSETGTITDIEQVVAGVWRGPCNTLASGGSVYPNLFVNGVSSQQIILTFGTGSYRIDVNNYTDSGCGPGFAHSKISYRNIVPSYTSTAIGGEFDLNLVTGTVIVNIPITPAFANLSTICGVSITGSPSTDIDVTGMGGACKFSATGLTDLEKLRVTTTGLMFGNLLPAGSSTRPSTVLTGKTYVR